MNSDHAPIIRYQLAQHKHKNSQVIVIHRKLNKCYLNKKTNTNIVTTKAPQDKTKLNNLSQQLKRKERVKI